MQLLSVEVGELFRGSEEKQLLCSRIPDSENIFRSVIILKLTSIPCLHRLCEGQAASYKLWRKWLSNGDSRIGKCMMCPRPSSRGSLEDELNLTCCHQKQGVAGSTFLCASLGWPFVLDPIRGLYKPSVFRSLFTNQEDHTQDGDPGTDQSVFLGDVFRQIVHA